MGGKSDCPFPDGRQGTHDSEIPSKAHDALAMKRSAIAAFFVYGNHPADVPLLETVGHPHVVEPTRALARIAARRSWPVRSSW